MGTSFAGVIRKRLISPDYLRAMREMHGTKKWGIGGHKYASDVRSIAESVKARTILDYGCGQGTLAIELKDYDVREYDPGVAGKDMLPEPADVVVCTDVMEHIEREHLHNVLRHIRNVTLKAAYIVIATRAADNLLPDGSNAHLIIEESRWWVNRFAKLRWKTLTILKDEPRLEVILVARV